MEKKDIIFALKIIIAGVLLGIFTGFLGVNPLGITQAQVVVALKSFFLGLGMLTVILTFYFIRKSHQAYQSYQREEEDEENEQDYLAMYRFLDYGTVAWNVCQISMLSCLLIDLGALGPSVASLLLIVLGIWAGVYCLKITSKIRNYKLSIMATPKEVLDYLDTYDEGEKQAEMEEAYLILFKVNQLLIPGIYVVLVVLSMVLGQVQLVALLVAVVIHMYMNVAQLRKTKRYFK
ncbi:DUF3169 family protein [Streptococcus infantis]|uniref:DUF3169 family protein n=1 Tax=Streptococcus infantis TaxID=68892 RepID=UPI001CBEF39E|nr:DUF3169 family protein [Streptococcus infantis]MBZ2120106.1 DUF3169 family protein [Streptococcus infantis]MBZ2122145.1 DUF3169 family protein [Streptococcus infantis]MBZ2125830.1 DUF3169 family protein [Streptococcus infantis]